MGAVGENPRGKVSRKPWGGGEKEGEARFLRRREAEPKGIEMRVVPIENVHFINF